MRYVFIVNPKAGKVNAKDVILPTLEKQMQEMGFIYDVFVTKYPKHAMEIAGRIAQEEKPVTFFSCGGDGTFNEVVDATHTYDNAYVCCIPCGSGNDFIRNFSQNAEPFLDLKDILRGKLIEVDLIEVNGRIATSICSAGLDAKVAYGIPKYRRMPLMGGATAYNLSILDCLVRPIGNKMKITIDGNVFDDNLLLACIANGGYYGGGVNSAPIADLQDGYMDIILVKKVSRIKIPKLLNKYKKGTHFIDGEIIKEMKDVVSYHRAKEITVTTENTFYINIDGECEKTHSLTARILPHETRVILPQTVYKQWRKLNFE